MVTHCYVREFANGSVYYPPTIPKPRINDSLYDIAPLFFYFICKVLVICSLNFYYCYYYYYSWTHLFRWYTVILLYVLFHKRTLRLCYPYISFLVLVSFSITAVFINEFVYRLKQIHLEKEHLESRYDGSFINLSNAIKFSAQNVMLFILTFSTTWYLKNKITTLHCSNIGSVLCVFMIALDVKKILNLVYI